MKPGIDVGMSNVIVDMSNDLWFRGLEVKAEEMRDRTPRNKSSSASYIFANETGGEQVAALESSSSGIKYGRF